MLMLGIIETDVQVLQRILAPERLRSKEASCQIVIWNDEALKWA